MVMASEVGVYDTDASNIVMKGRLKPGRMLLVDTEEKRYIQDEELKMKISTSRPYKTWLKELISIEDLRNSHSGPLEFHMEVNGDMYTKGLVNGDLKESMK